MCGLLHSHAAGAETGDLGESGVTHLVVSDDIDPTHIPTTPFRIHMVKQQWFWESIQIEASADEQLYQIQVSTGHVECVHGYA